MYPKTALNFSFLDLARIRSDPAPGNNLDGGRRWNVPFWWGYINDYNLHGVLVRLLYCEWSVLPFDPQCYVKRT